MERFPNVSVVMSVYNGAQKLSKTIESVLSQEGVDLEFIIIDDGSTDNSYDIIRDYNKTDPRIKFTKQKNHGLTRSLIYGCSLASGEFIARQDVGDTYLPAKLSKQVLAMNKHPSASMVTCGTRFIGPENEFLFDVIQSTTEANQGLKRLDIDHITGPSSHTSMMFRNEDYNHAGGYREQFAVSQDLDLWLRLIELGDIISVPEILIEGEIAPNTISGTSGTLQIALGKILIACANKRSKGEDERPLLCKAAKIERKNSRSSRYRQSASDYFMARMLQKNLDPKCMHYFKKALSANPLNWKAWLAMGWEVTGATRIHNK